MGYKISIRNIKVEIEYLLLIIIMISCVSNTVYKFFENYYICLLFIVFHELFHILIGTLFSKKLDKVFIGISGMTAFFKYYYSCRNRLYYLKECAVFLAGPVANLVIATVFNDIKFIREINIFLAMLNLLPIYPLDGFNILKNVLLALLINKRTIVNSIVKCLSILTLILLSLLCIMLVFKYGNIFCIIFLMYILFINIHKK